MRQFARLTLSGPSPEYVTYHKLPVYAGDKITRTPDPRGYQRLINFYKYSTCATKGTGRNSTIGFKGRSNTYTYWRISLDI